jgi:ABC-type nitrate/sulfonate/bicarbonate transport system substrate-binding protein
MAQELGLFTKRGLRVELAREVGWATVRDKMIYRELEAAHAPAGMVFAATFGLGSIPVPCLTALVLNLQGNAITLSEALWKSGVRDGTGLAASLRKRDRTRPLTLGIVSPFSSHHFLLNAWLLAHGIDPARDVRIVVVPPPQVFLNLRAGYLDGYCVGEPYNSLAVLGGEGWCAATSESIAPLHPEKVLMVRQDFAEDHHAEHLALVAALHEACRFCDQPANRERIMETLAEPQFIGAPIQALRMSMAGSFDFGHGHIEKMADFHLFYRKRANLPSLERAGWVLAQMRACQLLPDPAVVEAGAAAKAFRPDLFAAATTGL